FGEFLLTGGLADADGVGLAGAEGDVLAEGEELCPLGVLAHQLEVGLRTELHGDQRQLVRRGGVLPGAALPLELTALHLALRLDLHLIDLLLLQLLEAAALVDRLAAGALAEGVGIRRVALQFRPARFIARRVTARTRGGLATRRRCRAAGGALLERL